MRAYALTVGFEQMLIQRNAVGRDASEVLDTFSYYYGVVTNNFSYGAAAGLFKGVLSLILILAVYPFVQRHFAKGMLLGAIKG